MASSRYKIERMPDGIAVSARVVHDSQEIGFTAVFLMFSFALTCITPFYLEEHYFTNLEAILIPLLFTFYLVGSLVYSLLWQLFGRENIKIRNHTLSHGYTLFSIGRWRSFPLSEISEWHSRDHIPKAPIAQGREQRLPNENHIPKWYETKNSQYPQYFTYPKMCTRCMVFRLSGKNHTYRRFF